MDMYILYMYLSMHTLHIDIVMNNLAGLITSLNCMKQMHFLTFGIMIVRKQEIVPLVSMCPFSPSLSSSLSS